MPMVFLCLVRVTACQHHMGTKQMFHSVSYLPFPLVSYPISIVIPQFLPPCFLDFVKPSSMSSRWGKHVKSPKQDWQAAWEPWSQELLSVSQLPTLYVRVPILSPGSLGMEYNKEMGKTDAQL